MHKSDEPESAAAPIERELERELVEVETAIALVRSGGAREVTVANLTYGEEVLAQIRLSGAGWGVRLEPIPWPEDRGADIVVSRIDA